MCVKVAYVNFNDKRRYDDDDGSYGQNFFYQCLQERVTKVEINNDAVFMYNWCPPTLEVVLSAPDQHTGSLKRCQLRPNLVKLPINESFGE